MGTYDPIVGGVVLVVVVLVSGFVAASLTRRGWSLPAAVVVASVVAYVLALLTIPLVFR